MNRGQAAIVAFALIVGAGAWGGGVAVSGEVRLPDGAPAAGARVWLAGPWEVHYTEADGAGEFTFPSVPVEEYLLIASFPNMAYGIWHGLMDGDRSISLTLQPDLPLRYRVVARGMVPVLNARASLLIVNRAVSIPLDRLYAKGFPPMLADAEGNLNIRGFPPNTSVEALLRHSDYAAAYVPALETGTVFTVHLRPGWRVAGRVTDDEGAGVAIGRVIAYREAGEIEVILCETPTDADGFYSMRLEAPEGVHVVARAKDYPLSPPHRVDGHTGESGSLNIRLERAGFASGLVRDAENGPATGAPLLYLQDGRVLNRAFSGTDGRFEMAIAPGGTIQVIPPPGAWVDGPAVHALDDAQERQAVPPFVLRPLPVLTGRVTDGSGAPVARALASAGPDDAPRHTLTGADGRFELQLDHIAPGDRTTTVRAEHPQRFLRAEATVDFGSPDAGALVLQPYESRVSLPPGQGIEGLAVAFEAVAWLNVPREEALAHLQTARVTVLTYWTAFELGQNNRRRLELLEMLHQQFGDVEDVAIVAVHERGTHAGALTALVEEWGMTFPVAADSPDGAVGRALRALSAPETVLLDRQGRIRGREVSEMVLLESIKALRR